jgi:sulfate adenylyltransferase subunit 1 (EFTu-like GTPase family)
LVPIYISLSHFYKNKLYVIFYLKYTKLRFLRFYATVNDNENYLSKKQKYSIIINGIHLCLQNTNSLHQQKNIEFSYTNVKNVVKTNKIGKVTITNEKKIIIDNFFLKVI